MRNKENEYYSPVPKVMVITMLAGIAFCFIFTLLYKTANQRWMLSCAITFGVIAYHIVIRFLAPVILVAIFHKKYDHLSWWFQERKWEPEFYRLIKVKKWKVKAFTYDPSEFSLKLHSLQEIINNMCHAELVHELIVLLSFTSLLFAIPFGAFVVFLITATLAALFDMTFVILQRYNRPRVVNVSNCNRRLTN